MEMMPRNMSCIRGVHTVVHYNSSH